MIFGLRRAHGFLGAAFVAMLVAQQFTAFTLPTELFFYLALVMLVKIDPQGFRRTALPVKAGAARMMQAAVALPFAAFAIYLATGDAMLASARRALDQHDPDRAAYLVDRARSSNGAADFYFSRRFANAPARDPVERLRFWQYGYAAASHAPDTADDPQNALVNLAAFEAARNDANAVIATLGRAIAIAPNWYKPHWLLAQVLQQEQKTAQAREEAEAAAQCDGAKHPEVTATLDRLRSR